MNIKDVKVFQLTKDINGLAKGTKFERENGLFVATMTTTKEGEGYSFTKTETRKYSESVIEKILPSLEVVEYTEEYEKAIQLYKEALNAKCLTSKEVTDIVYSTSKPFKPRKKIRAQIAEYERQLAELEAGNTKFYDDAAKHEARTVWYNLIKALKWCINEDEQVC